MKAKAVKRSIMLSDTQLTSYWTIWQPRILKILKVHVLLVSGILKLTIITARVCFDECMKICLDIVFDKYRVYDIILLMKFHGIPIPQKH